MAEYIVCTRKRNSPRLNVRICKEKCPYKDDCKEYLSYQKVSSEPPPVHGAHEQAPVIAAIS